MLAMVQSVLEFFLNQFFTKPEVLLAVVVMVGYILLGRPAAKVISGSIKTAVGIMILSAGAAYITTTFRPLISIMQDALGLTGVIIDPYAGMPAAMKALGDSIQLVGYTIVLGFLLNLLYVKIFKLKAVFLTGHIMLIQASIMSWMVMYLMKTGPFATVFIASFLLSVYWSVFPHLLIKPTAAVISGNKNDTSRQDFTIGHSQMFADLLAFKFGGLFGKPEDNVEKIKLPGWLSIFQDNVISTSIIMMFFVSAFLIWAGPAAIAKQAGGQHWIAFMLFLGLKFAVAITIILTGVRMFIGELVPAFKGISEKWLPGSVPAIDVPALFPFAPKAVALGFMFTVIGQVVGVILLIIAKSKVMIIPGFVPMFFDGGPVGVYANASGGWKAVVVICTLLGITHVIGAALIFPMTGLAGGWVGNWDWDTFLGGLFYIMQIIGGGN
jgi:ascorbate PTS system EIIC component